MTNQQLKAHCEDVKTYAVNPNDAWLLCSDDEKSGSFVKWEDYLALRNRLESGSAISKVDDELRRHLGNLKIVADEAIADPESIYASEFFLLLDETFGTQGGYNEAVQAIAVSKLIDLIFTAPPVPELKPIVLPEIIYVREAGFIGYVYDANEIEEALKSNGVEVKL